MSMDFEYAIKKDIRNNPVLREEVVCHHTLAKKILLSKCLLLPIAGQQEEQLSRECVLFRLLVETPEEGIFLDMLEHEPGRHVLREDARQRGLADAYRPFDDNVPVVLDHGHARSPGYHTAIAGSRQLTPSGAGSRKDPHAPRNGPWYESRDG